MVLSHTLDLASDSLVHRRVRLVN